MYISRQNPQIPKYYRNEAHMSRYVSKMKVMKSKKIRSNAGCYELNTLKKIEQKYLNVFQM